MDYLLGCHIRPPCLPTTLPSCSSGRHRPNGASGALASATHPALRASGQVGEKSGATEPGSDHHRERADNSEHNPRPESAASAPVQLAAFTLAGRHQPSVAPKAGRALVDYSP